MPTDQLDLSAIPARLAKTKGRHYWRSLAELAETPTFREFLEREFPQGASEWTDAVSRRKFLQLMAASLGLAGLSACASQPPERILPYVQAPEAIVPGQPLFFATAMPLSGYAIGLLVESHMGRPTKVEGNPDHPASLGATDALAQASILTLYDPDRSKVVTHLGTRISTWSAFLEALAGELDALRPAQGEGLRILTGTVTSPTLASQLQALLTEFPAARWHQYEPLGRDNVRTGAQLAFGEVVHPRYRFDQAERILALDANFLAPGYPGNVRYARDFADRRRVREGQTDMSRLYVVESTPTITGAAADHRLALRAGQIEGFARAIAQELGVEVGSPVEPVPEYAHWLTVLAADLQEYRGASLVLAGDEQPPIVHALAHAMNQALDNAGNTVIYSAPVEAEPVDQLESLRELVEAMRAGQVQLLVIIGGNPVFDAPADFEFAERLFNVPTRIHWGLYEDETAELCQWHIPATHYLESWSDTRAYDGTVSIIQPLIQPLYEGKSAHELLAALIGQSGLSDYDLVRGYWESQKPAADFDQFWQTALHDGLIAGTELPPITVSLQADLATPSGSTAAVDGLELIFRPDPSLWDGRFANNGWLQELPKPLTKLTWDNAALISPATAERLGLVNEELIELRYRDRSVRAPVWIMPGQPDEAVTVYVGYGRSRAGRVGNETGFNAYSIRPSETFWFGSGLEIGQTGERYMLATTQHQHGLNPPEERIELVVRHGTLEQFRENPHFVHELEHASEEPLMSLYPEYKYDGYAWGMAIDLTACNGCNACVVACQAENNIPIVGKTEVARGREMHWLRIDLYYEGDLAQPASHHQPMLCQHCEKAPCEVPCPVAATVHSAEGLNEMVYNRCVGTRYCSNNCPYKVRRFNFLQYTDLDNPVLTLLRNPDVTVRSRGVMEKCTFCVQRINAARIEAKKENRTIRDGEIVTACQGVCPTRAIVFGNINDPDSQVAQLKAQPHGYGVLAELDTQPRITYLAELRNPHPELGEEGA